MSHLDIDPALRDTLLEVAGSVGTPAYVYNLDTVRNRCGQLRAAVEAVHPRTELLFAAKANCCRPVVETIIAAGFGLCFPHFFM